MALNIVVCIATAGRAELLCEMATALLDQSRPPDAIWVCAPAEIDVLGLGEQVPSACITLGVRGSCVQRNVLMKRARPEDILVFFDDDFLPSKNYIAEIEKVFNEHLDVVLVTGHVVADGATGPGFDFAEAQAMLSRYRAPTDAPALAETFSGYGCNMAVRAAPLLANDIFFDERLPLYGWLEDVDLSRRLACFGSIVRSSLASGVHLGVKRGRQSGKRLGYSQVANPLYLARKGTLPWLRALRQLSRNVTANCLHALQPEPYIDRRGRIVGNLRALFDFAIGRLDPQRVLEL